MEDPKTPNIAKGLASKLLALSTDKMPQSEVVPFLQSIVDAGAMKAVPYSIQNLIRMYAGWGDVTLPPPSTEGKTAEEAN